MNVKGVVWDLLIAVIGFAGGVAMTVGVNLDKIFPAENIVQLEYHGYTPTDDYEAELRYFLSVGETNYEEIFEQQVQSEMLLMQSVYPEEIRAEMDELMEIDKLVDIALEEMPSYDEIQAKMTPIYEKHLTLEELRTLNKLYSTEEMQSLTEKNIAVLEDVTPVMTEIMEDFGERYMELFLEELEKAKKEKSGADMGSG